MFRKASVLLADESNIVLTPGSNGKQRLVLSGTLHDTPHQVRTVGNNGQFSCDKNCIKWVTYKICAHTIAVAEAENQLRKFLNWYNSSVRKPNYTALANMDMPQGRGKKATKATQRRKGSSTERPEPVAFVSTVPRQDVSSDNACPTSFAKPTLPNPTPGS
ncbi:hypothetical protein FSP39_023641 [Pinctada imbricata]|uniref:Uncharacterized protein n=1 Tax=Pinctada imbricata TaxID=66713 RepID=A0AA89C462_PINIB|nr:hypothetical protein FSP39_023641 [Pinctada imbricata]